MKTATTEGNANQLKRSAHRLVGLFDQFGAHQAAEAAMTVETSSDPANAGQCETLLQQGRTAVDAIRKKQSAPA